MNWGQAMTAIIGSRLNAATCPKSLGFGVSDGPSIRQRRFNARDRTPSAQLDRLRGGRVDCRGRARGGLAVRQPAQEMGRVAADLLIGRIERQEHPDTGRRIVLPVEIVVRQSCGCKPKTSLVLH